MLKWPRMDTTALRNLAVGTLACLLIFPHPIATAGRLRDEALAYRREGYDRQQRGDLEGALGAYQKAAALDPSFATPYNDLGVLYEQSGDVEMARRSYEEALVIDPSYASAHANLALLYEKLGQKEKAIYHWLKRYQLGDPHDPWTIHAEARLIALGVLKSYPGLKSKIFSRRRVTEEAMSNHAQALREFRSVTKQWDQLVATPQTDNQ